MYCVTPSRAHTLQWIELHSVADLGEYSVWKQTKGQWWTQAKTSIRDVTSGEIQHHQLVGVVLGWRRVPVHQCKSRHIAESSAWRYGRAELDKSAAELEELSDRSFTHSHTHTQTQIQQTQLRPPLHATAARLHSGQKEPVERRSAKERRGAERERGAQTWRRAPSWNAALPWGHSEVAAPTLQHVRSAPLHAASLCGCCPRRGGWWVFKPMKKQVSSTVWFCFHPDLCCLDKCIQMHLGAQRTRSGHVSAAAT